MEEIKCDCCGKTLNPEDEFYSVKREIKGFNMIMNVECSSCYRNHFIYVIPYRKEEDKGYY